MAAGACLSALWALSGCLVPPDAGAPRVAQPALPRGQQGAAGPGIPSLALPGITALPLLPGGLCAIRLTCQGLWPAACSKRTQRKKKSLLQQGSRFAAKKRKLFDFSGQKRAENWDEKKDGKEIMQIKAHSDILQLYSEKAQRTFTNKQSQTCSSLKIKDNTKTAFKVETFIK